MGNIVDLLKAEMVEESGVDLKISIPKIQTFAGKNEVTQKIVYGIKCRQCDGTGFINEGNNKELCPMCGGSGEIAARVFVEWIPGIPIKSDHLRK